MTAVACPRQVRAAQLWTVKMSVLREQDGLHSGAKCTCALVELLPTYEPSREGMPAEQGRSGT